MSELVTGDAIRLEVRIAGLPSRSLALIVDLVLQVLLLALSTILVFWVFPAAEGGAAAALMLTVTVAVLVGWPAMVETVSGGRSLGKAMMGLRVVRDDGGPVRMRHALVRALAMVFLDLWVTSGVVGGLSALISKRSKRMGDHLAGTIVIGERVPRFVAAGMQAVVMPMPLASWASQLDLIAVPDQLALTTRTFLHRAPSMEPAAREATAVRLATQMATHVRTPAPWGTPAETYLAAVLAERSRRASAAPVGWQHANPATLGHPPVGGAPGWPAPVHPTWNGPTGPAPAVPSGGWHGSPIDVASSPAAGAGGPNDPRTVDPGADTGVTRPPAPPVATPPAPPPPGFSAPL